VLNNCYTFQIDSFEDDRGSLSVLEKDTNIPFDVMRLYYLYFTQDQTVRGAHAHKRLEQILVSFSGKFEVLLDDGVNQKKFLLDHPAKGLYVCPMIWREVTPIGNNGVCAVLASRKYEEEDYIHDYSEFIETFTKK
jgi:dTDP-4-dehydrorhamnose 3,5-epimerase-like enzyme